VGLQWGDEAKGKLVDLLAPKFDVVVRYQGGANAGHTVVVGGDVFKLHHIPSGILTPGVMNVVASGVVVNPPLLVSEMQDLASRGIEVGRNLMLSDRAHVVFPWHVAEDRVWNARKLDGESLGTTLRGIGPCYQDKMGRIHAIRLGDLLRDDLGDRVGAIVEAKQRWLQAWDPGAQFDAGSIVAEYQSYATRLRAHIADTTDYLLDAMETGRRVLFEGAQGALLDIDHGTFPFVTSSNSSGVGVCSGAGVPARWVEGVVGVVKAYSTRVGGGPFPTELADVTGDHIRVRGKEFGTTTGRPRRCGWFDAVAVRYAARLSGADVLAVMMLDVLSELPKIRICVAYELDGKPCPRFPSHAEQLRRVVPVYETLVGWQRDISEVRSWDGLPANAQRYLARIAALVGRPVEVASVGPEREQTMFGEGFGALAQLPDPGKHPAAVLRSRRSGYDPS
jgi:adenylosuccinate synthase